jgi:flagellar assembly factor FliW
MTNKPDFDSLLGQESRPIEFATGLIGFEDWKRFVMVTHPACEPLRLLQSLDDERVSFIIADPRQIVPDYRLVLSEVDAQALQYQGEHTLHASWPEGLDVYCILSVQEEPLSVTANLLGPLIVNWQADFGQQVILSDSNYDPRHPVAGHSAQPPIEEAGSE